MKNKSMPAKILAAVLTAVLVTAAAVPVFAAEDVDHTVAVMPEPGESVSVTVGNVFTGNGDASASPFLLTGRFVRFTKQAEWGMIVG